MIGILDSGLGAIQVLNYLLRSNKTTTYLLYLDYRANPLGTKQKDEINQCLNTGVDFLKKKGCEKIIIACNTLSVLAVERKMDVLTPVFFLQQFINQHQNQKIHLIATNFTVRSHIYSCLQTPASELVEMIEGRKKKDLLPYQHLLSDCDYLLLGCTHFGIYFPCERNEKIVDSAKLLADQLKVDKQPLKIIIYTTKMSPNIKNHLFRYLQCDRFEIRLLCQQKR